MFETMVSSIYETIKTSTLKGTSDKIKINETMKTK